MSSKLNLSQKNDYHIHSCYSRDSNLSCRKILEIAKDRGLELIAVTDHNTVKGGLKTKALAKERGFDIEVLVGAEIKTDSGVEIIGLNLKKEIKSRSLIPILKEIKRQGGLVVIPHPFRWNKKNIPIDKIKEYIDYIEVYNGRNPFNLSNIKANELALRFNLKPVSGSDAHFSFEIGNNRHNSVNWKGFIGFFLTGIFKVLYSIRQIISSI